MSRSLCACLRCSSESMHTSRVWTALQSSLPCQTTSPNRSVMPWMVCSLWTKVRDSALLLMCCLICGTVTTKSHACNGDTSNAVPLRFMLPDATENLCHSITTSAVYSVLIFGYAYTCNDSHACYTRVAFDACMICTCNADNRIADACCACNQDVHTNSCWSGDGGMPSFSHCVKCHTSKFDSLKPSTKLYPPRH